MYKVLNVLFFIGTVLTFSLYFAAQEGMRSTSESGGIEGDVMKLHSLVKTLQSARVRESEAIASLERNQADLAKKISELSKDLAIAQREADDWEYLCLKPRH